jgi:hypothetical protein
MLSMRSMREQGILLSMRSMREQMPCSRIDRIDRIAAFFIAAVANGSEYPRHYIIFMLKTTQNGRNHNEYFFQREGCVSVPYGPYPCNC